MTGRFLALVLIATGPFLAPAALHSGAASDVSPRPDRPAVWSTTRDGHAAIGHRAGRGTTYFIDAASLADATIGATQQGSLLTPGLTLVLNRGF